MKPLDSILSRLADLSAPHGYGHRCVDGAWYNPNAGTRHPCAVSVNLQQVRLEVERLAAAPHDAAHDDAAAMHVAMAATGYYPDWVEALDADDRAGLLQMGRMAIEGLAEHLDRDPTLEARAAAVRARLNGAMRLIDRAEGLAEQGDRL